MKKDVLITIKGIQTVDDEKDSTELFTVGNLYFKDKKAYITYEETAVTGFENCRTTLKIESSKKATLLRTGNSRSHLTMEIGKKSTGYYGTPYGQMVVGITANDMKTELTEDGGTFYCKYNIDVNSAHISTNEIFIDVKPNK